MGLMNMLMDHWYNNRVVGMLTEVLLTRSYYG